MDNKIIDVKISGGDATERLMLSLALGTTLVENKVNNVVVYDSDEKSVPLNHTSTASVFDLVRAIAPKLFTTTLVAIHNIGSTSPTEHSMQPMVVETQSMIEDRKREEEQKRWEEEHAMVAEAFRRRESKKEEV